MRQTPDSPETHSSQPAPSIPSVSTGAGTLRTGDWDCKCNCNCDRGCVLCVESWTVWMGVVVAGGETTIVYVPPETPSQQSTIHNPPQRLRFSWEAQKLGWTKGLPGGRETREGRPSGRVGRQRRTLSPVPVYTVPYTALTSHLCDCEVVTGE